MWNVATKPFSKRRNLRLLQPTLVFDKNLLTKSSRAVGTGSLRIGASKDIATRSISIFPARANFASISLLQFPLLKPLSNSIPGASSAHTYPKEWAPADRWQPAEFPAVMAGSHVRSRVVVSCGGLVWDNESAAICLYGRHILKWPGQW